MASQLSDPEDIKFTDAMEAHWLINMLVDRELLHSELLLRDCAHRLLSPILLRSFKAHLSWYIKDGKSYIETGSDTMCVRLSDGTNLEEMKVGIKRAQKENGIPPVAVLYS
ncbi:Armadillo-like helical [Penicillium expansum]|nr:Armadillo-like helical [Penicillium expansum]